MTLPGDIVEIGSFVGGGTRKLARYAKRFKKKVWAIDIFNPSIDLTICTKEVSMAEIYASILQKLRLITFQAYWFNVLIAISEEQFFRGLFGNVFISKLGSFLGSFTNGLFFMLFHIPRYYNNINALAVVFFAGLILTYIDYRTGRVSTSMLPTSLTT